MPSLDLIDYNALAGPHYRENQHQLGKAHFLNGNELLMISQNRSEKFLGQELTGLSGSACAFDPDDLCLVHQMAVAGNSLDCLADRAFRRFMSDENNGLLVFR